jgi:histidinol phosphatase-like enzyme (inositol monophosphatase family)
MTEHLRALAAFAESLADEARSILAAAGPAAAEHEIKADGSPVTPFDRRVETALRQRIAERYPGHGVLGEEHGAEALDAEFVWVIDPIDGTKQFIGGLPVYGTLIGLAIGGELAYGVLDFPATAERLSGGRGLGARLNGKTVACRPCAELGQALLASGIPTRDLAAERTAVDRLYRACRFAVWGGGSYAFAQVARGRLDIAAYRSLDAYDYAAAVPVIEAAGGRCLDWQGRPLTLTSGSRALLLGDPALAEPALAALAGTPSVPPLPPRRRAR